MKNRPRKATARSQQHRNDDVRVVGHRGQQDVNAQRLRALQVYQEEPDLFRIKKIRVMKGRRSAR